MKGLKKLHVHFQPKSYELHLDPSMAKAELIIQGVKTGRPSHRITLHQKNLKIKSAKILRKDKRDDIEFKIDRINHLNSFEEVRIHTAEVLYPGPYEIILDYQLPALQLTSNRLSREVMPSIDEPEVWSATEVKL